MIRYGTYSTGNKIIQPRVSPNACVSHKMTTRRKTIDTEYSLQLEIQAFRKRVYFVSLTLAYPILCIFDLRLTSDERVLHVCENLFAIGRTLN